MKMVTRKILSSLTLAVLLPLGALAGEGGNSGGGGGLAQMNYSVEVQSIKRIISAPENSFIFKGLDKKKLEDFLNRKRTIIFNNKYSPIEADHTTFSGDDSSVELSSEWTGDLRVARFQLFGKLALNNYSSLRSNTLTIDELLAVYNGTFVSLKGKTNRASALKIIDIIIQALKENPEQEVDPKSFEKYKDLSYFSVFSRELTRDSYLKVASLKDRNENAVVYKKYNDHIVMKNEAIESLQRCLFIRFDEQVNHDCAVELSLFYHELLRLAKYEDDDYGISSNAIPAFEKFLKQNKTL